MTMVSPSKWLCAVASKSPLLNQFALRHIPYGIDLNVFKPFNMNEIRKELMLPLETPLLLFGAADLSEERKGSAQVIELLKSLKQRNVEFGLVLFGEGSRSFKPPSGIKVYSFGKVSDEKKLAKIYGSADVFVLPSLSDNFPNTALESIACGTPVVAYDVGGVGEIVRCAETGHLARYRDPEDLRHGTELILKDRLMRQKLSVLCRAKGENEFSLELQTKRHIELYAELVRQFQAKL